MSKECIRNCPLIESITKEMDTNDFLAAVGPMHPDMFGGEGTGINRLLSVCERSYECSGATIEPVEVIKGFFRQRTEIEYQKRCGLREDRQ